MAERPFGAVLADALATLRSERPGNARTVGEALGTRRVRLQVDGDVSVVCASPDGATLAAEIEGPADVEVATSRAAVVGLVEGTTTLLDAVVSGGVRLRGPADDLIAFDAALMAFVDGAVRAPSMLAHWDRYLDGSDDVG